MVPNTPFPQKMNKFTNEEMNRTAIQEDKLENDVRSRTKKS